MKISLIVAAALLALGTLPALAGEGNGEPFAFQTPGITTAVGAQVADTGSSAYPDVTGRAGSSLSVFAGSLAPDTGSEAPVQTANSLPVGAEQGTFAHFVQPNLVAPTLMATASYAPRG
jgi:hypothetical protein